MIMCFIKKKIAFNLIELDMYFVLKDHFLSDEFSGERRYTRIIFMICVHYLLINC